MKILFQGDSITDVARSRDNEHYTGHGYATMVTGVLGLKYPERYRFLNRGVSGNRIVDIYARMKTDIINLNPDYMSILVGANDVWHKFINNNGVDTPKYEKIYSMLVEEILTALPDIKIMILEPFCLNGSAMEVTDNHKCIYAEFRADIEEKASVAKCIADKFNLSFIPLQAKFDSVYNSNTPTYWSFDGVHPTAAGHALIAREWLDMFNKIKSE